MIDCLQGAKYLSKIDLRFCYHQIQRIENDILKTTFYTHYVHYEFVSIPFGLTTTSTMCQSHENYFWCYSLLFIVGSKTRAALHVKVPSFRDHFENGGDRKASWLWCPKTWLQGKILCNNVVTSNGFNEFYEFYV